ncbi:MAG: peptidylprolyl isomerase, partial [Pseudomonadota bacterium]
RARQILLRTEAEAQEARERAVVGEDFAALAEALSIDSATRRRGGDLGYFAADAGDPQISRAAFRTRVGEVSEPFETEEGWRIVKVLDRRSARPPSFSSRAEEIEAYLVLQAVRDVIRDLRRDADIEIFNPGPAPRRTADEDASPAGAPAPALKGLTQPAEISQETASDAPKAPKPATAEGESPAED